MSRHQLTIHYDDELELAISRRAEAAGTTRNRAAVELIRAGAGLVKKSDFESARGLLKYLGTMSEDEADQIIASVEFHDQVDLDSGR